MQFLKEFCKGFRSQRVKLQMIICTVYYIIYYIIQIHGDLKYVLKEMHIGRNNFEKKVLRVNNDRKNSFFFLLCQLQVVWFKNIHNML